MFFEFTHKSDGKAVLINMDLVRYVYPMADGCDLIFDANHSASVSESPAEIRQWLATGHDRKTRARKGRKPTVDASLQAIAKAAKGPTT
jgi:hypothetical protein